MSVNAPASWSAQALRTSAGNPSGPFASRRFTLRKADLTSATVTMCKAAAWTVGADDVIPPSFCSKRALNKACQEGTGCC